MQYLIAKIESLFASKSYVDNAVAQSGNPVVSVTAPSGEVTVQKKDGSTNSFYAAPNILQRNTQYNVGDVVTAFNAPSWATFECIQAGTTAATEPDFSGITSGTGSITAPYLTNEEQDIQQLQQDVSSLQTTVAGLQVTDGSLQQSYLNVQSQVNSVQSNVNSMQTTVTQNTNSIASLQTNVTSLQSTTAQNTSNISSLQNDVSKLHGTVSGLTAEIVNVLYPIGIVVSVISSDTPPFLSYRTWQQVGQGRVLWGADSSHAAGSTISAGVPDVFGSFNVVGVEDSTQNTFSGAFYKNGSKSYFGAGHSNGSQPTIAFDASRSNAIYGNSSTVQPPALVVTFYERVS